MQYRQLAFELQNSHVCEKRSKVFMHLSSSSSSNLFFSALSLASNLALVKTKCIDPKSLLQKIQLTSDF